MLSASDEKNVNLQKSTYNMQFQEIIGQREFINNLIEMTLNGRVPHTQLFFGNEGNQKLAIAIAYSQFLNCEHRILFENGDLKADSCGECSSCKKINNLEYSDLHFIFPNNNSDELGVKDSSSENYIKQWEEMILQNDATFSLNQWLKKLGIGNKQGFINKRDIDRILKIMSYKNYEAKYRVLILWLPETFYHDSATRLLKVLEEPSEGTVFIMVSENISTLATTILSRAQRFNIPALKNEDIIKFLSKNFSDFPQEHCEDIAEQANGNLVLAKIIASNADDYIENHNLFVTWMRHCYKFNLAELSPFCDKISKMGRENAKNFLNQCLNEFNHCLLLNNNNNDYVKISVEERNFLNNFAAYVTEDNLPVIYKEIEKATYHIERNVQISLVMLDLSLIFSKALRENKLKVKS
jgi:DNA polymerase-3 subunit delta'